MRILRPNDPGYPVMGSVTRRYDRLPVGVELANPDNFTGRTVRRMQPTHVWPAAVAFDPDVTERICEALIAWPTDIAGLNSLERHLAEEVFVRYERSLSLWIDKDLTHWELVRVMVEEFCDADQEGLIRLGNPFAGEDPRRWYKNMDAINTWRVARLLVLRRDESGA